jgi:hypothetical protein
MYIVFGSDVARKPGPWMDAGTWRGSLTSTTADFLLTTNSNYSAWSYTRSLAVAIELQ